MRYVGGKERIAKWVVENLLSVRGEATRYVEPFVGGAAVLTRMVDHFDVVEAGDSHEDLILLLKAVADGWAPPESVSRAEYEAAKFAPPSALRGAIGFGSSWSGKWFGGYVGSAYDKHWDRMTVPYAKAAARSLVKASDKIKKATIVQRDYEQWNLGHGDLVYCDPPYANTLGYSGTEKFDSAKFWETAGKWAHNGAVVVVSESEAPCDWNILAERTRKAFLKVPEGKENDMRSEKLFIKGEGK